MGGVKSRFVSGSGDFLNSSELKLKLRATTKFDVGNFIINNHVQSLSLYGGGVWSFENEGSTQTDKNSLEAYAGLEYHVFEMGDWEILKSMGLFMLIHIHLGKGG